MSGAFARLMAEFFDPADPCLADGAPSPSVFNPELLAIGLQAAGMCPAGASPADVIDMYLDRPECRMVSPNPLFDEVWYRFVNPDVAAEIADGLYLSGFQHFVRYGVHEGRWPNASPAAQADAAATRPIADEINDSILLDGYPAARVFLDSFPWLSVKQYYNLYGRRLGYESAAVTWRTPVTDLLASEFDAEHYRRHFMQGGTGPVAAFEHYLQIGAREGFSPNSWFDEGFYRAYYPDVAEAIGLGTLVCGFHHFLMYGRPEGRFASHDLRLVLERALPGVTEPTLLRRVNDLRAKIDFGTPRPPVAEASGRRRVWFIFPVINPDIAFGGYQAAFALMVELHRAGFDLGVICMEERKPNRSYFVWRQSHPDYIAAFSDCPFHGNNDYNELALRKGDLFVVYSVWGLELGEHLAALTSTRLPYLFAQEYEPIFYANDALQVLCEDYYRRPHYPIINSRFLLKFFSERRVGIFREPVEEFVDYAWFEHALNAMPRQSADQMRARTAHSVIVYARPEAHAGRNLFDIIVIALQDLCREGIFDGSWSFIGLGALSDLDDVRLSDDHHLELRKKVDTQDYARLMGGIDIGISLMCAPHPSLVPFEMAMTGALVVTNSFTNRSPEEISAISGNLIACELGLASFKAAIREALRRVPDADARERDTLRAPPRGWREIFDAGFIARVFGAAAIAAEDRPASHDDKDPSPPENPAERRNTMLGRFLGILDRRRNPEDFGSLVSD